MFSFDIRAAHYKNLIRSTFIQDAGRMFRSTQAKQSAIIDSAVRRYGQLTRVIHSHVFVLMCLVIQILPINISLFFILSRVTISVGTRMNDRTYS